MDDYRVCAVCVYGGDVVNKRKGHWHEYILLRHTWMSNLAILEHHQGCGKDEDTNGARAKEQHAGPDQSVNEFHTQSLRSINVSF
jgi:hypothetical protein